MDPDILCLQETKAASEETKTALELLSDYKVYVNSSKARKGYSGTAILSKTEPINVVYDMGLEEHDQEGRVITAEFDTFFIVVVYTPNSGDGLLRLDYREGWDRDFLRHIQKLMVTKPVILCGDLNVAHQEIDIARAKENYNKSAGFTQREIDGFQAYLNAGLVDTFRRLHPEEIKYTYWNYKFFARDRNVGWRIDYFLVPEALMEKVTAAEIYNEYFGSDHCPVGIRLAL